MQLTYGKAYVGAAKKLTDADILTAAKAAPCDPVLLRAIIQVETGGRGFDDYGRPIILFEPHVMYRVVFDPTIKKHLVLAGVAYPVWGSMPYPAGQDAQYKRLETATSIAGASLAVEACSWGMGQVLGENYRTAGYASPLEMVKGAMLSEAAHLMMMVNYLRANRLVEPLQKHQFYTVAAGYNGTGQAEVYANNLAQAVEHLAGTPLLTSLAVPGRVQQSVRTDVTLHPGSGALIIPEPGETADELMSEELATLSRP